jgi:ribose transport system ATP-binding protein
LSPTLKPAGGVAHNSDGEAHSFIEAVGLSKHYGAIAALRDVSVDITRGEIHGLVGANGAGKSTFVRILAGVTSPDSGVLLIDGMPATFGSAQASANLGLRFIHQELCLVPKLSVLENMTMGLKKPGVGGVFVNWRALREEAMQTAERLHMRVPLRTPVERLSVGDQWLVSIGRALLHKAQMIAMDEPTASLSAPEAEILFGITRELARSGVAILYVTHRLDEVTQLCDRVTIFRDGQRIATIPQSEATKETLVRGIVGADVAPMRITATGGRDGLPAIELRHVRREPAVRDVSFSIAHGEIVGLAGLEGAGRTETARMIFGADRPDSGEVLVEGKTLRGLNTATAVARGIALIPEERRSQGLVMAENLAFNVNLPSMNALRRVRALPFITKRAAEARARRMMESLQIKAESARAGVSELSGGNQQKVVIGKWMLGDARIVIFDEPTRGVDVGARAGIYRIIQQLAEEGKSILLISSEFEELALCCSRVLVMVEGRIVGELSGADVTEEAIVRMCYGQHVEEFAS